MGIYSYASPTLCCHLPAWLLPKLLCQLAIRNLSVSYVSAGITESDHLLHERPGLSPVYNGPVKWVPLESHSTNVETEAQVTVLFTSTCSSTYSPMPTTQTSARRTLLLFSTTSCSWGRGWVSEWTVPEHRERHRLQQQQQKKAYLALLTPQL